MHNSQRLAGLLAKVERIAVTLASEVGETRREELVEAMNRHMDEAKLLLAWVGDQAYYMTTRRF